MGWAREYGGGARVSTWAMGVVGARHHLSLPEHAQVAATLEAPAVRAVVCERSKLFAEMPAVVLVELLPPSSELGLGHLLGDLGRRPISATRYRVSRLLVLDQHVRRPHLGA